MATEDLLEGISKAKQQNVLNKAKSSQEEKSGTGGNEAARYSDVGEVPENPEEETGADPAPWQERYDRLLASHGIPDTAEFLHKREQLYLMVDQGLTDSIIEKLINYPSRLIDRLRLVMFMTGEDYLLKVLPAEQPDEEQVRGWITDYVLESNPQVIPANASVEKSLDVMGRYMVRQSQIASEQAARLTEYMKRMSEISLEKSERAIHDLQEERLQERENMQKQISLLSDENFRLTMKMEEERQEREEEKKAAADLGMESEPEQRNWGENQGLGYFAKRRRVREAREREDFIAAILRSSEFTPDQLTVVNRVVEKGFSLEQLRRICDPKVRPENMELLEAYYERRKHA